MKVDKRFVCLNGAMEKRAAWDFLQDYYSLLRPNADKILCGTPTLISIDKGTGRTNMSCGNIAYLLGGATKIIIGSSKDPNKAEAKKWDWEDAGYCASTKPISPKTFKKLLRSIKRKTDIVMMMSGEHKDYIEVWKKYNKGIINFFIMSLTKARFSWIPCLCNFDFRRWVAITSTSPDHQISNQEGAK